MSMQAIHDAIAEGNQDLGGYALTRTTLPILPGATVWPVESTFGWASSGYFLARGVLYSYAGKTLTTVEGVAYTDGDTPFPGAAVALRAETVLMDQTRARSALDLLRRSFLVEYAEGADLSSVGRNLGIDRAPTISSDDIFRAILKALAYAPYGTTYAIEALLDAALGAGNYSIFEDLISHPCEIFVRVGGAASQVDRFAGKAFLTGRENQPATGGSTLSVLETPLRVVSVRFADENHTSDFRNQLPSTDTIEEYDGDPGTQVWNYTGPSEIADVVQIPGEGIQITDASAVAFARYDRTARIQPESDALLNIVTLLDSASTWGANATQWSGGVFDGGRAVAWGVTNIDAGTVNLGFRNGGILFGSPVVLNKDAYYAIEIRKYGQSHADLLVNGQLADRQNYTLFGVTTNTLFVFGSNHAAGMTFIGRVRQAGFASRTPTDYWASRGSAGAVAVGDPDQIDINTPILVAGDVGKRVIISGGITANPEGGSNNGTFEIATVDGTDTATLVGPGHVGGTVSTGSARFVASGRPFQFPDDLGKALTIYNASNALNNGSFVIDQLLDPVDDITDLQASATPTPVKARVAVVTGSSFVTETGLEFRIDPNFVTESGLTWNLSDTGSHVGANLTLRQALPTLVGGAGATRILKVLYDRVLSAQALPDTNTRNVAIDKATQAYTHYPFYLADPFGYLLAYLDLITAAGVIPRVTTL